MGQSLHCMATEPFVWGSIDPSPRVERPSSAGALSVRHHLDRMMQGTVSCLEMCKVVA